MMIMMIMRHERLTQLMITINREVQNLFYSCNVLVQCFFFEFQAAEGRLKKANEPFSIRRKDFYNIEHAQWILEKLMPKITHETDGLLFQPSKDVGFSLILLC